MISRSRISESPIRGGAVASHLLPMLALFLATVTTPLRAQVPAPSWDILYSPMQSGASDLVPMATRMLADGSYMVVGPDNFGLSAVRYDEAGNVLSQVTLNPYGLPQLAIIDPFGGIVTIEYGLFIEKFDGITGRSAWTQPVAVALPSYTGATAQDAAIDTFDFQSLYVLAYSQPLGCNNYYLIKIEMLTGTIDWTEALLPPYSCGPALSRVLIDGANVFVGGMADNGWAIFSIDPLTGTIFYGPLTLPTTATGMPIFSGMVAGPASVYVTGGAGDKAYVVRVGLDGSILWGPVTSQLGILTVDGNDDLLMAGAQIISSQGQSSWDVVKYSGVDGSVLWGPLSLNLTQTSSDTPTGIALDGQNNLFVTGTAVDSGTTTTETVEFSGSNGNLLWGPLTIPGLTTYGVTSPTIVADALGNVIVSTLGSAAGSPEWLTAAYHGGSGSILFGPVSFSGNGPNATTPVSVLTDTNGDVLTLTRAFSYLIFGQTNAVTFSLTKRDGITGAVVWGPIVSHGSFGAGDSVSLDSAGNPTLAITQSNAAGADVMVLSKYSGITGAVIWGPVTLGGSSGDSSVGAMEIDTSGDLFIVGPLNGTASMLKLSGADGSVLWTTPIPINPTRIISLALLQDQNPVVGSRGWAFVKLDSTSGSILWDQTGLGITGQLRSLVSDGLGNLFATGNGLSPLLDGTWVTVKLSGSTGGVLWGPTYEAAVGSPTRALADASGNAIVGGWLLNGLGYQAWGFSKYSGIDGSSLWGPISLGGFSVNSGDAAWDMSLNSAGNVVAAGSIDELSGKSDGGLAAIDSLSGAIVWGPLLCQQQATTSFLKVAPRGNDIVVGSSGVGGSRLINYSFALGVAAPVEVLPIASCASGYDELLLGTGGVPPYTWSVSNGFLPAGLFLSSASGQLSGTPTSPGTSSFTIRLTDSMNSFAERGYDLTVLESSYVPIQVQPETFVCPGAAITLAVYNSYQSYQWYPTGETTPMITVTPTNPTVYGVMVTEAGGCTHHGSVLIGVGFGDPPRLTAPLMVPVGATAVIASAANLVYGTFKWTLLGGTITAGQGSSAVLFDAGPPGVTMILSVVETAATGCTSESVSTRIQVDFLDVPPTDPFHDFVDSIARNGVSAGCGSGDFCPTDYVLRSQMAVFLLRGEHGSAYVPPAAVGIFSDVPSSNPFAPWIEELYKEGITGGCSTNPLMYCPNDVVTRATMAALLLRAKHGSSYQPPPNIAGIFGDVPASNPFARWIEELYHEGITGGCSTNPLMYCPDDPVNRAQMAVFLVATFSLP